MQGLTAEELAQRVLDFLEREKSEASCENHNQEGDEDMEETQGEVVVNGSGAHIPKAISIDKKVIERVDTALTLFDVKGISFAKMIDEANEAIKIAKHWQEQARKAKRERITSKYKPGNKVVACAWHKRIAADIELGRTIAVRGPAGNGKSTGVRAVLEGLKYRIYHLDCTDSTTVDQLVGGIMPEPDGKGALQMVFRDGLFVRAFKDKKAAIQLDEFDALDPRVAMALQSALHRSSRADRKRWLSAPDHHEGGFLSAGPCPIVVTMNTYGSGATREYVGRNAIDAASLDRFSTLIDTTYENEVDMLHMLGFDTQTADDVVKHAQKIREKIDQKGLRVILSTRRLIDICESMEALAITRNASFKREFFSRLEEVDLKALGGEKGAM